MTKFDFIKDYFSNAEPKVGIVLGSGLNNLLDSIDIEKTLSYSDIPGFPQSTVPGHEGSFVLGKSGNVQILAAKGRFHFYEGYDLETVLSIMKSFYAVGIKEVIITNAAGLMDRKHKPGDILLIKNCIDMTNQASVLKAGTAVIGESERNLAFKAAEVSNVKLGEGIYVWTTGPSYETPSEIEYFTSLGGDLVGMSTMPEIMWAREHKMNVYPFSCATNWASGIANQPLTHEEVNETAQHVRKDLTRYILTLCKLIGD
ncbi:MAG: purine-nucleoside phosphorylase [Candidatus Marinimicrobia bacterium]|nr:purine-nucleoside phosphorylase [Candidatus Neomarinimicrobiota bacterium]